MYSLELGKWTEMPSMGTERTYHSCAQLGTDIYVLGGKGLMSTEIFDLNTNTWTSGPNITNNLAYGYAFTYHDNLYAIRQEGTVYKLSDDKKKWAQISDIGQIGKLGQRTITPELVVGRNILHC